MKEQLGNPVWHVHNGNPPKEKNIISFGVLLNLVSVSNASSEDVLWKFVKNFSPDLDRSKHPILEGLITNAIAYFNDHVKIHKKYRQANELETKALLELIQEIKKMPSAHPRYA